MQVNGGVGGLVVRKGNKAAGYAALYSHMTEFLSGSFKQYLLRHESGLYKQVVYKAAYHGGLLRQDPCVFFK